jgi:hypothetical protein
MHWTILGGLLTSSSDILGALTIIGCQLHHHRLPLGLLLRLLMGLLLVPSSINIASQCEVVLLHLLKFCIDESQFIF